MAMVVDKKGKEWDAGSPQGKMIVASKGEKDKGKGSSMGASKIVASLRKEFSGLNKHLAFRFEDIKKAILGTPDEQRQKRLEGENVPPPPPPGDEGGGEGEEKKGFLGRLKGIYAGMGTKTGILLLVAGLTLLSQFGERLVKPLAAMLKWFDKEGSILDKLKDTKLFQGIVDAFKKIKTEGEGVVASILQFLTDFESMKKTVEDIGIELQKLVTAAEGVKDMITAAYKTVNDYIMSFDTQAEGEEGHGVLDAEERKALYESLSGMVVDKLVEFFTGVMGGIVAGVLGLTLINATVKLALANPAVIAIFTGKAMEFATAPGAMAGGGMAAAIPIAGLLLYGITTTWSNISSSLKKTLDDNNGKMDFSDFFANFFGGKDDGGALNALMQAFKLGGTFALVGMGIGAAVGTPFLMTLPGAIAGGLIGIAVGMVIGGITGWIGSAKIRGWADKIGVMVSDVVDRIGNFFGNVIAGFKSFFKGKGFMQGYNDSRYANKNAAERELMDVQDEIAAFESGEAGKGWKPETIEYKVAQLKEKEQELQMTITDAPQHKINLAREKIDERQKVIQRQLDKLIPAEAALRRTGKTGGADIKAAEIARLRKEMEINAGDLQRMPGQKDTLRTTLENAEAQAEQLRKEKIAKQNAIVNQKFDSAPLGAGTGMQGLNMIGNLDKSNVNNFATFQNGALNVDSGYSSSYLYNGKVIQIEYAPGL